MSKKRRTFSADFKTKIMLELLCGDNTIAQLATKYQLSAKNLIRWKQQFLENASLAFDANSDIKAYKEKIDELKKKNNALVKKLGKTAIKRFNRGKDNVNDENVQNAT